MLCEAQLAGEGVHRLRKDGAVRWASTPPDGAAAAVEEPQLHTTLARDLVQRTVGFVDLPGAGNHAAVFVGVGVAEHDLLPVLPGLQQWPVRLTGPKLTHYGWRILQVLDGLEERDRL